MEEARKDSAHAAELATLKNRLATLEKANVALTNEEASMFTDAQARCNSVAQCFGQQAPRPLAGEAPLAYRKRLIKPYVRHSPAWSAAGAEAIPVMPEKAFAVAEKQIYANAQASANNPVGLPPLTLREIRKNLGGREVREFVGDPNAWMGNFKSVVQKVPGGRSGFQHHECEELTHGDRSPHSRPVPDNQRVRQLQHLLRGLRPRRVLRSAVRFALAGGTYLGSSQSTTPMFGGCAITEGIRNGSGGIDTNPGYTNSLGTLINYASTVTAASGANASLGQITGFSVFNQQNHGITTPQSPVPSFGTGNGVGFFRLGSGARIPVLIEPELVSSTGYLITSYFSWDFQHPDADPVRRSNGYDHDRRHGVRGHQRRAKLPLSQPQHPQVRYHRQCDQHLRGDHRRHRRQHGGERQLRRQHVHRQRALHHCRVQLGWCRLLRYHRRIAGDQPGARHPPRQGLGVQYRELNDRSVECRSLTGNMEPVRFLRRHSAVKEK